MMQQQPAGWARRATVADPGLRHQIRLVLGGAGGHPLLVTCNCSLRPHGMRPRPFDTLEQAWALYQSHLDEP